MNVPEEVVLGKPLTGEVPFAAVVALIDELGFTPDEVCEIAINPGWVNVTTFARNTKTGRWDKKLVIGKAIVENGSPSIGLLGTDDAVATVTHTYRVVREADAPTPEVGIPS